MASKKNSNGGQSPKTPEQLKAQADASARYRSNLKVKGIPPTDGMDSLIAEACVKSFAIDTERLGGWMRSARDMVFDLTGWDKADKALVAAVDTRIMKLLER